MSLSIEKFELDYGDDMDQEVHVTSCTMILAIWAAEQSWPALFLHKQDSLCPPPHLFPMQRGTCMACLWREQHRHSVGSLW